jgi:glycosidase
MTDYTRFGIPRQHPAVVKGRAGSPYAIADYYDVDPDLAQNVRKRMDEFQRLVARTHRAGLKVVIDFVPNHVAREYRSVAKPEGVRDFGEDDDTTQGFSPQNNFYYCPGQPFSPYLDLYHGELLPYEEQPAKATGNDHLDNAPGRNDWYETVKLNYGVDYYAGRIGHFDPIPDTWHKMLDVLLFWAGKGVDAFRCDMVFMVPVEFWRWVIPQVKEKYPDLRFIGEIYDPWLYRDYIAAGFDWLYDKVGMYDTLRDIICHRRRAADITQHILKCCFCRLHIALRVHETEGCRGEWVPVYHLSARGAVFIGGSFLVFRQTAVVLLLSEVTVDIDALCPGARTF